MDVLYARGTATAAEVQEALPDPPSYSAIRALLRTLEEKGHVQHEQDGPRYVYRPTVSRDRARRSALHHLLDTFFEGSTEEAVATLLELRPDEVDAATLDRIQTFIDRAREEGR